jgi:disulfide bond formation protein DsbB
MKCFKHNAEAVAICPWCGRAMCAPCASAASSTGLRLACSEECAQALARSEGALEMLLQKSRQSARANSVYYYLCGGLSAGAAVASWYWLPIPFLIWFLAASAVALAISGVWFGRAAKESKK